MTLEESTHQTGEREKRPEFIEWVERGKALRRWGGFVYEETCVRATSGRKVYAVTRIEGDWPSDVDLMTLCDGDAPAHPSHFGGHVDSPFIGETKTVTVHID